MSEKRRMAALAERIARSAATDGTATAVKVGDNPLTLGWAFITPPAMGTFGTWDLEVEGNFLSLAPVSVRFGTLPRLQFSGQALGTKLTLGTGRWPKHITLLQGFGELRTDG